VVEIRVDSEVSSEWWGEEGSLESLPNTQSLLHPGGR